MKRRGVGTSVVVEIVKAAAPQIAEQLGHAVRERLQRRDAEADRERKRWARLMREAREGKP